MRRYRDLTPVGSLQAGTQVDVERDREEAEDDGD